MPQVIRVKRNVTSINGPAALDPGELGYTGFGSTHNLYVGDGTGTVQSLVNPNRQVEIAGAQTITGIKTFDAVGKLNVIGGAVGAVLQSADPVTGALIFGPAVAAAQLFVGSFDGSTGVVTFTTASGGAGPGLPAPAAANSGWYVIANVAGATVPGGAGAGVTGPFEVGDWLISNGTAWTHLDFGGTAVSTASDVGVSPAVAGGTDVQTVLETLDAEHATFVVGPATSVLDNIATYSDATGKVIKDGGVAIASLATVTYVDSENAAQDLIITANAAFVAAQPAIDAAQDAAIAAAGDVIGPASAVANNVAVFSGTTGKLIADSGKALPATFGDVVGPAASAIDNIATYSDATGKLIKDGGVPIASLATAAALAGYLPLVGGTVTGAIQLPAPMPVAATEAAHKAYVDQEIAAVSAGASVTVTGPELTGTGLSSAPITFTGITIAANSATSLVGNGLSLTGLDLVLVDGGVYA